MKLVPCSSCHRHVDASVAACPFCGASPAALSDLPLMQRIVTRETVAVAVGIGLALTACACYGPPPRSMGPAPEPPAQQPNGTATQQPAPGSPGYAQPPPGERAR